MIITRLSVAGYGTSFAREGLEAVNSIQTNRPHAAILDVNMPNLDGFGVMRKLREAGLLARMPVMVLTARNSPEDVHRAIQMGARDFLSKPFKDAQLLDRVARLLRAGPAPAKPSIYI